MIVNKQAVERRIEYVSSRRENLAHIAIELVRVDADAKHIATIKRADTQCVEELVLLRELAWVIWLQEGKCNHVKARELRSKLTQKGARV